MFIITLNLSVMRIKTAIGFLEDGCLDQKFRTLMSPLTPDEGLCKLEEFGGELCKMNKNEATEIISLN